MLLDIYIAPEFISSARLPLQLIVLWVRDFQCKANDIYKWTDWRETENDYLTDRLYIGKQVNRQTFWSDWDCSLSGTLSLSVEATGLAPKWLHPMEQLLRRCPLGTV